MIYHLINHMPTHNMITSAYSTLSTHSQILSWQPCKVKSGSGLGMRLITYATDYSFVLCSELSHSPHSHSPHCHTPHTHTPHTVTFPHCRTPHTVTLSHCSNPWRNWTIKMGWRRSWLPEGTWSTAYILCARFSLEIYLQMVHSTIHVHVVVWFPDLIWRVYQYNAPWDTSNPHWGWFLVWDQD